MLVGLTVLFSDSCGESVYNKGIKCEADWCVNHGLQSNQLSVVEEDEKKMEKIAVIPISMYSSTYILATLGVLLDRESSQNMIRYFKGINPQSSGICRLFLRIMAHRYVLIRREFINSLMLVSYIPLSMLHCIRKIYMYYIPSF